MSAAVIRRDGWIRRFHPSPEARTRLVCLPHAGGMAGYYFPVSAALSPSTDVIVVQYPGRGDRLREPTVDSMTELADRIVEALEPHRDLPLALFGHSMGATLAFEVTRRLEAGGPGPFALFVSGRSAPSCRRKKSVHRYSDEELLAHLRAMGGTDPSLFDDEELLRLFLPAIRSDYRALETYVHQPGSVVGCPISAFVGDEDPGFTLDEVRAWRDHTVHDFRLTEFPGGHFYLKEQAAAVTGAVAAEIRRLSPGGGGL